MVQEHEVWKQLLCNALAALAAPAEEQVRAFGPGCVPCELSEDFVHARLVTIDNAQDLSAEQRALLDTIDATLETLQPDDYECFNNEVVRRQVWQQLRDLAMSALRAFGWEKAKLLPATEIEPGVWIGPTTER